jgi:hypothetical protein
LEPPPSNISNVLWQFKSGVYKRKVEKLETASATATD